MIVILEDDVFASPHTRLDLLAVLQLGFEGWHRVQTDPPYDAAANRSINQWLQRLDEKTREEAEFVLAIGMEQLCTFEQLFLGFNPVGVRDAAIDRTDGRALFLVEMTDAFRALLGHYVVEII